MADDEQRKEIQQQAKLLAEGKGLDWKALSVEERRGLKRSVREQMEPKKP